MIVVEEVKMKKRSQSKVSWLALLCDPALYSVCVCLWVCAARLMNLSHLCFFIYYFLFLFFVFPYFCFTFLSFFFFVLQKSTATSHTHTYTHTYTHKININVYSYKKKSWRSKCQLGR